MRHSFLILLALAPAALAQSPQQQPQPQRLPAPAKMLPGQLPPSTVVPDLLKPGVAAKATPLSPAEGQVQVPAVDESVALPRAEGRVKIDGGRLALWQAPEGWQVLNGKAVVHQTGASLSDAEDVRRAVRETLAAEWVTVGKPGAVVQYGLLDGQASPGAPRVRHSVPIDLATLRADAVRGVWVLRDAASIVANFGSARQEAEQAAAAARRYGFNRVGTVGSATAGGTPFTFFYYGTAVEGEAGHRPAAADALTRRAAEDALTRTGIPVPGTAQFLGEKLTLDPRKVQVRRDKTEYVLAHGNDVLGHFAQDEWAARDAQKVIQDCRFTEFCTLGACHFFLSNGQAPTRVPFAVQSSRFDPKTIRVRPAEKAFTVCDAAGRKLFDAATAEEAEQVVKLVQGYHFDTLCQAGASPRTALTFLARTGTR